MMLGLVLVGLAEVRLGCTNFVHYGTKQKLNISNVEHNLVLSSTTVMFV
jgi:hypothetical protein